MKQRTGNGRPASRDDAALNTIGVCREQEARKNDVRSRRPMTAKQRVEVCAKRAWIPQRERDLIQALFDLRQAEGAARKAIANQHLFVDPDLLAKKQRKYRREVIRARKALRLVVRNQTRYRGEADRPIQKSSVNGRRASLGIPSDPNKGRKDSPNRWRENSVSDFCILCPMLPKTTVRRIVERVKSYERRLELLGAAIEKQHFFPDLNAEKLADAALRGLRRTRDLGFADCSERTERSWSRRRINLSHVKAPRGPTAEALDELARLGELTILQLDDLGQELMKGKNLNDAAKACGISVATAYRRREAVRHLLRSDHESAMAIFSENVS